MQMATRHSDDCRYFSDTYMPFALSCIDLVRAMRAKLNIKFPRTQNAK
jgi:hypothetical protein